MTPSPPSAHPSGISLNHVTKNFGRKQVLTDVTADLPAGRIYGLLGSNGVGKTTLMSLICGHQFRTGGHILIDGIDPVENPLVLQRTCFVHEDQLYNDAFSVRDILAVIPAFYPTWSAETADRLVTRFRLPLDTKSKKLSRGQRSALAITLSLASRAAYTFLDEPYLGLDASSRSILSISTALSSPAASCWACTASFCALAPLSWVSACLSSTSASSFATVAASWRMLSSFCC